MHGCLERAAARSGKAVLLAAVALWLAPTAQAAVQNVTTAAGLRTAISTANNTAADDVINLAAGDYVLTGAAGDDANVSGDLDVWDRGKLTLAGAGAATTKINANGVDRALHEVEMDADADKPDLTLTGLTVTGGSALFGGGVYANPHSKLTVQRSAFTTNTATTGNTGGGIEMDDTATLAIDASTFSGNKAGTSNGFGGAVQLFHDSKLTITNSAFTTNSVGEAGPGSGGAVQVDGPGGTIAVTGSTFTGNTAGKAGGGFGGAFQVGHDNHLTIDRSTLAQNTAGSTSGNGGALQLDNGVILDVSSSSLTGNTAGQGSGGFGGAIQQGTGGTATILSSTLSANKAGLAGIGNGGAIESDATATLNITNSTVSGNTAGTTTSFGGGLEVSSSVHGALKNVTLANNTAGGTGTGGGIDTNAPVLLSAANTIVASNSATSSPNCTHPLVSSGHNLESATGCGFTAAGDLRSTNPLLGPLQGNGGPTQTRALLAGSPAIDAGAGCPANDQRGVLRPQGPACDIGAFEVAVPATLVTTELGAIGLSRASASPKTFAVDPKGRVEAPVSAKARRVKLGTTFRFTLSRAGRVVVLFERRAKGRRVRKRCRRPTKRNRKRKRCTRYVRAGAFAYQGVVGRNSKKFSGRIRRRKLRPGRYRVTLTAIDSAGVKSPRKRLNVRIVKRPRKRAKRR